MAKKQGKTDMGVVGIWFGVFAIVAFLAIGTGFINLPGFGATVPGGEGKQQLDGLKETGNCQQNPAYTYSGVDKYSTTTLTGTNHIKVNAQKPVSSLANPPVGEALKFWLDNSSAFCDVKSEDAVKCGSQLLQTTCYLNVSSISVTMYDQDNRITIANGGATTSTTDNVTIGANDRANIELTYQGVAKRAGMPFGGCMAIEVPTTVTEITLNGAGVSSLTACPYTWTYSVSSTSNYAKLYAIPMGFDMDALGDLKRMNIQLASGDSNPSGTGYITFMPTNYYETNAGDIVLGIEKDKNADTTKTKGQLEKVSFVIE